MSEQKTVLVLGASFAGLSAAHYFLRHIYPALPSKESYTVTLVGESTHFYSRPATPRALAAPDLMPASKVFSEIAPGFKQYPAGSFTFVQGTATALDPEARTVQVKTVEGETTTINYYALVIATGTKTVSPILGLTSDHKTLQTLQASFSKAMLEAKSIVIAGGGPAGVETAGEIAETLNGKPGKAAKNPKCKITIVTSEAKLLPVLPAKFATNAQKLLANLGVSVVYNTRVESVTPEGTGVAPSDASVTSKASVKLSSGETLEADLYIPATGVTPNTQFIPTALLNSKGYVETNPSTMRVDAAGSLVYCLGDVGSYTIGGVLDINNNTPVVMSNMKRDMLAEEPGKPTTGADKAYKPTKDTQLVPVGRGKGVGAFNGNGLPSFMVWLIKGRDYFVSKSQGYIDGTAWKKA